jgi:carbonic anhydrase
LIGVPTVAAAAMVASSASTAVAAPSTTEAAPRRQSPIDIRSRSAVAATKLPELVVDYPRHVDLHVHYVSKDAPGDAAGCTVRGPEETVEAEIPAGTAAVHVGGIRYELTQFHFHTHSEHELDGHRFPLEQHFVHTGPKGQTLVVGLLLTGGGRGGSLQDEVLRARVQECGPTKDITADLRSTLPHDLSTFRYDGSLTTAPYTEGVSWLVLRQHQAISDSAVEAFQKLFPKGNARELQPLNGRTVEYRRQR